jgi:hypothetical protein
MLITQLKPAISAIVYLKTKAVAPDVALNLTRCLGGQTNFAEHGHGRQNLIDNSQW